MHIRKEMAAETLASTRKLLAGWERKLKNPEPIVIQRDGQGQPVETAEVPEGAMVIQTLGEEDTIKLRAELSAVCATLEGLAGT